MFLSLELLLLQASEVGSMKTAVVKLVNSEKKKVKVPFRSAI